MTRWQDGGSEPSWTRLERYAVPLGLIVLAAVLRLPSLATRGTWDGDQGHDMLMLRTLVRDGVVPLLGPPTSIGDVHHGALYYYLLAPSALVGGGDSPLAVVTWIALAGTLAVAVTWWLARAIAGPIAGLVAGLAMAVSPAAIDESTFIWNPNLIALSSAVALAGAWQAWTSRRPAWWILAGGGTAVTMQCHVLGVTLLPIVGALFVADLRRRPPGERSAVRRGGLVGFGLIVLSFVPLVVHELTTNFGEVNAALDYLGSGGEPPAQGPAGRFVFIAARVVSWPLVGLIVDGVAAAMLSLVAVGAIATWRGMVGRSAERTASRWLGLGLVWTAFALTFLSPSLATVVRGLPNDHYHAFADPMVFVLVGIGAAALWRLRPLPVRSTGQDAGSVWRVAVAPGRLLAVVGVVAIVGWAATHLPPAIHPDGGFPAAAAAATRIEVAAGPRPISLVSLPVFKSVEAYAYPLVRDGWRLEMADAVGEATLRRGGGGNAVSAADTALVVICDRLFEAVIGAACGGPAETAFVPADRGSPVDRFDASPGRVISIYAPAGAVAP